MKKKRNFKTKKFFLVGAVIICVVTLGVIYWPSSDKPIPHHNILDTKIAQYSDKHITTNAITTNPQFKNIAFEASTPAKSGLFSNQIAAVIRTFKYFTQTPQQTGPLESGTWIWTPVMEMTPTYMDSTLSEAKANGINTVYLSIDSYLDIFVMLKGPARENQKAAFGAKLEDFISRAKKLGMAVYAEAGWRNWAEGDNTYKAYAVISYVKNFNTSHENKFRGFQYDVEPYLLDSYENNKAEILTNFVALIDKTQYYLNGSDLKFAVVVPDFYDKNDEMTPKFSYDGNKDYAFGHLLNVLDKRPGSSIIIMSYRSFATGYDGSIEISQNEMNTSNYGAHQTKVIIAQETGDVTPLYLTFYRTSKKHLSTEIGIINDTYDKYPNFGGIAIHYANAFLALK